MTEIVYVPFHGDEILTVEIEGKPWVILKPAVEALGVDYWTQVEKLRSRSWACTSQRPVQLPGDNQRRDVVMCDVRTFLMLLATIDERRVSVDVKDKLVTYQAEVADAIESYWTQGGAINPRAAEVARPQSQLDVLAAAVAEMQRIEHDVRETRAEVRAIAGRAEDTLATVTEIAARQDAIEGRHDWFAGLAYSRLKQWQTDLPSVQRLGRRAGAIARRAGIKPVKVQHGLYGEVNQLPAWCWDQARTELYGEAS